MCQILDEMRNEERERGERIGRREGKEEGRKETKIQNAVSLISLGKLTNEEIADALGMPLSEVIELAGGKTA